MEGQKCGKRILRNGVHRKESWCMLGDFNEILHNGEKLGGPRRGDSSFLPFKDMLHSCQMSELTSQGNGFTWGGMRYTHWVQCKLDRCFGNKAWLKQFPVANQTFLEKRGSDHRPVLVSLTTSKEAYKGNFKFDKRLFNKPNVKDAIWNAWNWGQARRGVSVSGKVRLCRKVLSKSKRENNHNSHARISQIKVVLEAEESANPPNARRVYEVKKDLCHAYREEEVFWSQKSQEKWVREGDKNTKFFHASVRANRGKKRLDTLMDVNGNFQKGEASKGSVAEAYFCDLFTSSNPSNFLDLFQDFIPKVTNEMNNELIKEVSKEEVS